MEQNVHLALEVASRGYVLERGRIGFSGTGRELRENAHIQRAYLGL